MALVVSKDTAETLEAEIRILGKMYHAKSITKPYLKVFFGSLAKP